MKKLYATILAVLGIICFAGAGTALAAYSKNTSRLSGFNPGDTISYKVLSSEGLVSKGTQEVDNEGNVTFTYDFPDNNAHDYLVYDFRIENNKDVMNVLVRVNARTGEVVATGSGMDGFSDVSLTTPFDDVQTKADWAGLFHEKTRLDREKAAFPEFKIALYGTGAFQMAERTKSPSIIQVLSAPGGGGPGTGGVNNFTTSPTIPYPLSTSSSSHVNDTIDKIKENYIQALMLMTEQLSAVGMQQVAIVGEFLDGKQQLETQRLHQELKAEAVKDYHPSEEMCRVGSYVRSIAKAEQKAEGDKRKFNEILMSRYTSLYNASTTEGYAVDVAARMRQFREVYCNPLDHNNGLDFMCEHDQDNKPSNSTRGSAPNGGLGAVDNQRMNKDIDYLRTMEFPKTLDLDFAESALTEDEEDVIALAENLYWPQPLEWTPEKFAGKRSQAFMEAKKIVAVNNVAHNTYVTLAGMKAKAEPITGSVEPGWMFMKTFMREFGITDAEIEDLIGENPSYWAQMEILTNKMYQSPHFYTNLYSKPANVERMSVALDAIKLMQMRDHFDSSLRREMLNAAMVEVELWSDFKAVNSNLMANK